MSGAAVMEKPVLKGVRVRQGETCCRMCGCSETKPCNPPCSWVDGDLCSGCFDVARAVVAWKQSAYRPSMPALLREVQAVEAFGKLPTRRAGGAR